MTPGDSIKDDAYYDAIEARAKDSIGIANTANFYRRKFRELTLADRPKETVDEAFLKLKNYLKQFTDHSDPKIDIDILYTLAKAFVKAYEREHGKIQNAYPC